MPEKRSHEKPGRPTEYKGPRKPITTQWPVDIIEYIDSVTDNRTKWLLEAAREKIAREKRELLKEEE